MGCGASTQPGPAAKQAVAGAVMKDKPAGLVSMEESLADAIKSWGKSVFEQFDTDKNGVLDNKELSRALKSLPKTKPTMAPPNAKYMSVEEMVTAMDADGSGGIDLDEWLSNLQKCAGLAAALADAVGDSGVVEKFRSFEQQKAKREKEIAELAGKMDTASDEEKAKIAEEMAEYERQVASLAKKITEANANAAARAGAPAPPPEPPAAAEPPPPEPEPEPPAAESRRPAGGGRGGGARPGRGRVSRTSGRDEDISGQDACEGAEATRVWFIRLRRWCNLINDVVLTCVTVSGCCTMLTRDRGADEGNVWYCWRWIGRAVFFNCKDTAVRSLLTHCHLATPRPHPSTAPTSPARLAATNAPAKPASAARPAPIELSFLPSLSRRHMSGGARPHKRATGYAPQKSMAPKKAAAAADEAMSTGRPMVAERYGGRATELLSLFGGIECITTKGRQRACGADDCSRDGRDAGYRDRGAQQAASTQ